MGLLPSGAVNTDNLGIIRLPQIGRFPTVWETSRSDNKGSLVKGAGCEQCEQTEGLNNRALPI